MGVARPTSWGGIVYLTKECKDAYTAADVYTHEYLHLLLHHFVGRKASAALDRLRWGDFVPHGLRHQFQRSGA